MSETVFQLDERFARCRHPAQAWCAPHVHHGRPCRTRRENGAVERAVHARKRAQQRCDARVAEHQRAQIRAPKHLRCVHGGVKKKVRVPVSKSPRMEDHPLRRSARRLARAGADESFVFADVPDMGCSVRAHGKAPYVLEERAVRPDACARVCVWRLTSGMFRRARRSAPRCDAPAGLRVKRRLSTRRSVWHALWRNTSAKLSISRRRRLTRCAPRTALRNTSRNGRPSVSRRRPRTSCV